MEATHAQRGVTLAYQKQKKTFKDEYADCGQDVYTCKHSMQKHTGAQTHTHGCTHTFVCCNVQRCPLQVVACIEINVLHLAVLDQRPNAACRL